MTSLPCQHLSLAKPLWATFRTSYVLRTKNSNSRYEYKWIVWKIRFILILFLFKLSFCSKRYAIFNLLWILYSYPPFCSSCAVAVSKLRLAGGSDGLLALFSPRYVQTILKILLFRAHTQWITYIYVRNILPCTLVLIFLYARHLWGKKMCPMFWYFERRNLT